MTYKEAVKELWAWQYSNTGCFHNMLFDLIAKSDGVNRIKLMLAYPEEVQTYIDWYSNPTSDGFFEGHGFSKGTVYRLGEQVII